MPLTLARLIEVGQRIRALYPSREPERVTATVTDQVIRGLAEGVTGKIGGKIGVAPRVFLRSLVDVLDRADQYPRFDPERDYDLVLAPNDLTDEERAAAGMARSVDDIVLELGEQDAGQP